MPSTWKQSRNKHLTYTYINTPDMQILQHLEKKQNHPVWWMHVCICERGIKKKRKKSHIWNLSQQHLLCFLRTLLAFVSQTFKQAHIHIFMRMLNNLGKLPRRTIMRGSVWVDFCLTELFPVELYFYSVLKASCSTCHTDSQRSVCSPRTLNEVMAKTVEPMTCE